MKATILKIEPSKSFSGKTFPRKLVEAMVLEYNSHRPMALSNEGVLVQDLSIEGDDLVAEVVPLGTISGKEVEQLLATGKYAFRANGMGSWDENNVIQEYTLTSIDLMYVGGEDGDG